MKTTKIYYYAGLRLRVTISDKMATKIEIMGVSDRKKDSVSFLNFDLSLLRGTDFQKSVWKEIAKIPKGKTMSYQQVAKNIGRPLAFRAVAQACGQNPIPVLIPCHRVVGKNNLGGYTPKIEYKIKLLRYEGIYLLS